MWAQYEVVEHGGTRNVFNKMPSGWKLRRVIEWRVNQSFEDHHCSCHQGGKDGPRNFGFSPFNHLTAAASPRIFY